LESHGRGNRDKTADGTGAWPLAQGSFWSRTLQKLMTWVLMPPATNDRDWREEQKHTRSLQSSSSQGRVVVHWFLPMDGDANGRME
jgi:hypothetical protein